MVVFAIVVKAHRYGFSSTNRVAHKPCDSNQPTTIPGLVVQAPLSPIPVVFHHRATCSRGRVLGCRGFLVERAAAQVWKEASGRVGLGHPCLDFGPFNPQDGRRIQGYG